MDLIINKYVSVVYLIGVFLLILPSFINQENDLRIFLKNISIWIVIILFLLFLMLFFNIL